MKGQRIVFSKYVYNPGDLQCIGSSGKVFSQQVIRLQSLGLIGDAIDQYSEEEFECIMDRVNKKNVKEPSSEVILMQEVPIQTITTEIYQHSDVQLKITSLPKNTIPWVSLAAAVALLDSKLNKDTQEFYNLISVEKNKKDDYFYIAGFIEKYIHNNRDQIKKFIVEYSNNDLDFLNSIVFCLKNESISDKLTKDQHNFFENLTVSELDLLVDHPVSLFIFINALLSWQLPPLAVSNKINEQKEEIIFFNDEYYLAPGVLQIRDKFHLIVGHDSVLNELLT